MASQIKGFDTITLQVADLGRSLLFYGNVLGLEFSERGQHSAGAHVGGVRLLLHEDFDPAVRSNPNRGVGVGLHFSVPDVDACHRDLASKGLRAEMPKNEPWGREFSVRDPDGYEIEFIGPMK